MNMKDIARHIRIFDKDPSDDLVTKRVDEYDKAGKWLEQLAMPMRMKTDKQCRANMSWIINISSVSETKTSTSPSPALPSSPRHASRHALSRSTSSRPAASHWPSTSAQDVRR